MLGPVLAFLILWYLPLGFDVVFVVSFAAALIGVAVIALLVDGSRQTADVQTQDRVTLRNAFGLLRENSYRRLVISGTILSCATVSDSFIFLALQEHLGFSTTYFPLLFVAVAGVNSLLAVPLGRLADRTGRKAVWLAGHGLLLCVYAAVLFGGTWVTFVVALICLGVYYAATDGVLTAMTSVRLSEDLRGSGLALLSTSTNLARLVASLAFGAMWHWLGREVALVAFGAAMTVALTLASTIDTDEKMVRN
jgi:predicted MFS family arabinose efflux permease